jgi:hypothetical protein
LVCEEIQTTVSRRGLASAARYETRCCAVGDQRLGLWQSIEHEPRALVIAHLAFGKHHHQWLASAVAYDGAVLSSSSLSCARCNGKEPLFFKRLAAVRCAFKCVESIMMRSGFGQDANEKPSRFRRMKRRSAVNQPLR